MNPSPLMPDFNNASQSDNRQAVYMIFAVIILIVAWFIPNGKLVFYPLSLMATWFHEFGHALAALLVGGKVASLQIFTNLSGVTRTALPVGASVFKRAFVIAGGPVMPAIIGSLMIMSGRNIVTTKIALWALVGLMLSTVIAYGMYSSGLALIGLIAVGLGYALIKADDEILRVIVHVAGIQGAISIFATYSYLKMNNAAIGGRVVTTDSQAIAALTGLSQQFWAISFTSFSIIVMILAFLFSFGYIIRKKSY